MADYSREETPYWQIQAERRKAAIRAQVDTISFNATVAGDSRWCSLCGNGVPADETAEGLHREWHRWLFETTAPKNWP